MISPWSQGSSPLHMTADGLPVGVMFTAVDGREDRPFPILVGAPGWVLLSAAR